MLRLIVSMKLAIASISSDNDGDRNMRVHSTEGHSERGLEENQDNENDLWLDLGEDSNDDRESVLRKALADAEQNNISAKAKLEL